MLSLVSEMLGRKIGQLRVSLYSIRKNLVFRKSWVFDRVGCKVETTVFGSKRCTFFIHHPFNPFYIYIQHSMHTLTHKPIIRCKTDQQNEIQKRVLLQRSRINIYIHFKLTFI